MLDFNFQESSDVKGVLVNFYFLMAYTLILYDMWRRHQCFPCVGHSTIPTLDASTGCMCACPYVNKTHTTMYIGLLLTYGRSENSKTNHRVFSCSRKVALHM